MPLGAGQLYFVKNSFVFKNNGKKIVATIEARMTSSRLPGKVLLPLAGIPALELLITRLKKSKFIDEIIVATTTNNDDEPVVELAKGMGVKSFRGSELDVLSRVLGAVQSVQADIIVEVTGDCPFVDSVLVDNGIDKFFSGEYDYAANIIPVSYPIGFDVQVFSVSVLAQVESLTINPLDRVHVSYYIYCHPEKFKLLSWRAPKENEWPELRLTLDEKADYELLDTIAKRFLPTNLYFSATEVVSLLRREPALLKINAHVRQKNILEG